jgi:putative DNA primase/helicase
MRKTTKQAAKGKWDGIIAQLLGEQAISRRHTSCPICGGEDRYRYDNKRNDGDWFCNICGVGDGFKLLTEALAIDFAEAARRVDRIVGNIEEQPFRESIDIESRRKAMNYAWQYARHPNVVVDYLKGRGIPAEIIGVAQDLRGHGELLYFDSEKNQSYRPAMLAMIRNAKGVPISIHRTYIGADSKEKKIMPPLETITGGCVRLGEPDETLVLAEGIETALAAWAITGHPAWATISAHGLAEFKSIPRHVKKVIVAGDNDKSFTGQAAAFECAKYMKQRMQVEAEVILPQEIGWDMVDVLDDYLGDKEAHGWYRDPDVALLSWL